MVSVVCVHVGHLTQVPHFQGSVVRHCVELIIFFVESDALRSLKPLTLTVMVSRWPRNDWICFWLWMSHMRTTLSFPPETRYLPFGEIAWQTTSSKWPSALRLNFSPLKNIFFCVSRSPVCYFTQWLTSNQTTIFCTSDDTFVVLHPFQTGDGLFMTLDESPFKLIIVDHLLLLNCIVDGFFLKFRKACVVAGDIVEQFSLLFQQMHLHSSR